MITGQREGCLVVVEGRGTPGNVIMAKSTIIRETALNMIGVNGSIEVIYMASHTVGG